MINQPGFLGTGASLASDVTLLMYLLVLAPAMLLGFVFARRRMYVPHHRLIMTLVVLLNWVFIVGLMFGSYAGGVAPYLASSPGDPVIVLPTIHLLTGAVAQGLATYLALRMWFEKRLPQWIMVRNIKRYMRLTLALWLITIALGVTTYATWYVRPVRAENALPPAATPDVRGTAEAQPVETQETGFPDPASTDDASPQAQETPEALSDTGEGTTTTPRLVRTPEVTPETLPDIVRTPEVTPDPDEGGADADDDESGQGRGRGRGGDDNEDDN